MLSDQLAHKIVVLCMEFSHYLSFPNTSALFSSSLASFFHGFIFLLLVKKINKQHITKEPFLKSPTICTAQMEVKYHHTEPTIVSAYVIIAANIQGNCETGVVYGLLETKYYT